jgi:hypothetical protein
MSAMYFRLIFDQKKFRSPYSPKVIFGFWTHKDSKSLPKSFLIKNQPTLLTLFLTLEMIFMQIGCNLEVLEKKSLFQNFDLFLPIYTPFGQNQIFWSK